MKQPYNPSSEHIEREPEELTRGLNVDQALQGKWDQVQLKGKSKSNQYYSVSSKQFYGIR